MSSGLGFGVIPWHTELLGVWIFWLHNSGWLKVNCLCCWVKLSIPHFFNLQESGAEPEAFLSLAQLPAEQAGFLPSGKNFGVFPAVINISGQSHPPAWMQGVMRVKNEDIAVREPWLWDKVQGQEWSCPTGCWHTFLSSSRHHQTKKFWCCLTQILLLSPNSVCNLFLSEFLISIHPIMKFIVVKSDKRIMWHHPESKSWPRACPREG